MHAFLSNCPVVKTHRALLSLRLCINELSKKRRPRPLAFLRLLCANAPVSGGSEFCPPQDAVKRSFFAADARGAARTPQSVDDRLRGVQPPTPLACVPSLRVLPRCP